MSFNEYQKANFQMMGQYPGNWRATADELRYSAIILREKGQILIDSH